MSARDVYTGRVIWKRMLHDLGTYNVYYDETYKETPTDTRYNQVHIPGANIRGTNFVATLDSLYVIQGNETHVLDTATGTLTYINGGHEPPLIAAGGAVKRFLEPTGPAVGMWPKVDFQLGEVCLAPGDILVGYTDGVTEAHSPGGAMFGKKRLLDLVAGRTSSAAEMVEHIRTHLFDHVADAAPFDDISMIAVQRRPEKKTA